MSIRCTDGFESGDERRCGGHLERERGDRRRLAAVGNEGIEIIVTTSSEQKARVVDLMYKRVVQDVDLFEEVLQSEKHSGGTSLNCSQTLLVRNFVRYLRVL